VHFGSVTPELTELICELLVRHGKKTGVLSRISPDILDRFLQSFHHIANSFGYVSLLFAMGATLLCWAEYTLGSATHFFLVIYWLVVDIVIEIFTLRCGLFPYTWTISLLSLRSRGGRNIVMTISVCLLAFFGTDITELRQILCTFSQPVACTRKITVNLTYRPIWKLVAFTPHSAPRDISDAEINFICLCRMLRDFRRNLPDIAA